jgi:hypothetical protein
MWSDLLVFLWAYLSHWQSYATGGVVTGIIAVFERLSGKQLPKKAYAWIFIICFSLAAFFMAWREEYKRANNLDHQNTILTTTNENLVKTLNGKKEGNQYEISFDKHFAVLNTTRAFALLVNGIKEPDASSMCQLKVTSLHENINVAKALGSLAQATGCRVLPIEDPDSSPEAKTQAETGAVSNYVVVHGPKDDLKVESFASALRNTFAIQRDYSLPKDSSPNLVWLQVGGGNVWRKD